MRNKIIPYNPVLVELAKKLRKQGVLSEVILWKAIKAKSLGVEFHRQIPLDEFIVDFYCHELMLAIEIDGSTHQSEIAFENDKVTQIKLEKYGISFIRFQDNEVKKNLQGVLFLLEEKTKEMKNRI